jgi:hypothetical protein
MTLTVKVYINDRQVAEAKASNISDLADISDYECRVGEAKSEFSPPMIGLFKISGHKRKQSCWALVQKIAARAVMG